MSTPRVACVFPGQGSQRKGMGEGLFERYEDLVTAADEVLGYSIRELCLENPGGNLKFTAYTQPALYVVNALTWLERQRTLPPPDFLAGHSLGEYNALFAAGCFDFATGLRLVQQRGALMSQIQEGGMAAVLGLPAERVAAVLREQGAAVDIANYNLATQLVLSGPKAQLEALIEPMERAGARKCLILNVSGAFHSRYMAEVAAEFEIFLRGLVFAPPRIPVIANATGRPYEADTVAIRLVEQIRSSVRWSETQDLFLREGVTELEELGPGQVLTKLWKAANEAAQEAATGAAQEAPQAVPQAVPQSPAGFVPQAPAPGGLGTTAQTLGDEAFRRAYGLSYAYGGGAPCRGIRTAEWVIGLAQGGCLAFLDPREESGASPGVVGTPALGDPALRTAIETVRRALGPQAPFGVSLHPPPAGLDHPNFHGEEAAVATALELGVDSAEAVGYHRITPALVRFRYQGARRDADGRPVARRRLLALVQRPGTAQLFLRPAPDKLLLQLVHQGQLTAAEAEIARHLPLASDLCAVTGSGDGPDLVNLLPSLRRRRDGAMAEHGYGERIRVGAGGALGTPEAVACAFFLGADFVHPSSIHLCCRQGGLPEKVRRHLVTLEPGDTVSAPAAEGFSLGARVQVVKKGSFFAPRAQKLYELFRYYGSLEAIDTLTREKLEQTYFKRSFAEIWNSLAAAHPQETAQADAKTRLALVFSWYLNRSLRWALEGHDEEKVNFQIPCDEAVAAFNLYTANTDLADPQNRTAPAIAHRLLEDAAAFLRQRVEDSG